MPSLTTDLVKLIVGTVKSRPLAALVDKPQAQIMCQNPIKC